MMIEMLEQVVKLSSQGFTIEESVIILSNDPKFGRLANELATVSGIKLKTFMVEVDGLELQVIN